MDENVTWAVLPGAPRCVPLARKLVREALASNPEAAEIAALAVSELVTNAIQHSSSGRGGLVAVVVQRDGPSKLCIGVRDDNGKGANEPSTGRPDVWDETGRGLALVSAITCGWWTARVGKYRWTWCRIRLDGVSL